jgi:hypothetical protein
MDEDELKAKVGEFFELLLERHEPRYRAIAAAHFIKEGGSWHIEKQMRDFYAEYGRWPVIQRDPSGRAIVMETKGDVEEAGVWEDHPNVSRSPRPISEEGRRVGREDKELRAALRRAFCQMDPARREERAKERGMSAEEHIEKEVDGCVEAGWGEGFRLYHIKHGRYPEYTELTEVVWMALEERRKDEETNNRNPGAADNR